MSDYREVIEYYVGLMIDDGAISPDFKVRVADYLDQVGEVAEGFNLLIQHDPDCDVTIAWRRGRWWVTSIITMEYVSTLVMIGTRIDYVGRELTMPEAVTELHQQLQRTLSED